MPRLMTEPIWGPVKLLFEDKFELVLKNLVFADMNFSRYTIKLVKCL